MKPSDWQGTVGDRWADEWRRTDRSFAGLDPALEQTITATMPDGAARLVDIGCGAGTTGLAVATGRPGARVTGIDLSPGLIAVARRRAKEAGRADRCRFMVGDAPSLVADVAPIDGLFSRHGVMFFEDPVAAFRALASASRPGAALVFSCFAPLADNPWATETVPSPPPPPGNTPPPPGPFAFADPARVAAALAESGWDASAPRHVRYRYVAGGGADPVADAVSFFQRIGPAARALADAGEAARPALLDRLHNACAARLAAGEVAFPAAAWIWTARLRDGG